MTAAVANAVRGRPSAALLADRLERSRLRNVILEDEVTALEAERATVGTEVRALSARIQIAVRADRPDLALNVAGRLQNLADQLLRRGTAA